MNLTDQDGILQSMKQLTFLAAVCELSVKIAPADLGQRVANIKPTKQKKNLK